MRDIRQIGAFFASAALAGAVFLPTDAQAFFREVPGMSCLAHGSDPTNAEQVGRFVGDNGGAANSLGGATWHWDGGPGRLLCPIADDQTLQKDKVTRVNIHGRDNHGTQQPGAAACVTWDTGGSCGKTRNPTTVSGAYTIALRSDAADGNNDLKPWHDNAFAWATVFVQLPPKVSAPSGVAGIYLDNL